MMKCSVCGSTNLIKINEEKKGQYNLEQYCCKDCFHVDTYCFDFKKKNELDHKVTVLVNYLKDLRLKSAGNKLLALNSLKDCCITIDAKLNNNNLKTFINELNEEINNLNSYLDIEKLVSKEEVEVYDENGIPETKEIVYIGDFAVNYKDCPNGGKSIFFFMSHKEYKDLESVHNHGNSLDMMDEYFKKEALNHKYKVIDESIKDSDWYKEADNKLSLKTETKNIDKWIKNYNL